MTMLNSETLTNDEFSGHNSSGVVRRKIFVLDLDETLIHSQRDGYFTEITSSVKKN
jgi:hypothetical protein